VYSEKPLTMTFSQAQALVDLANRKVSIYPQPVSCFGETAQTLWKALRNNEIGTVRVVYAEMTKVQFIYRISSMAQSFGCSFPLPDEYEVAIH